ncbi:MAG: hypothetical protein EAX90_04425 [Candidatus Heimdallarchaeota archaeon]|nr:hypothetical protein [Candidatus Heimdallarchaeota archaeon]
MNDQKRDQIIFIVCLTTGIIFLAGILLSVDFLYAGIQELFLSNINPDYIPDEQLANKVILASSLSIGIGLALYVLDIWFIVRKSRIEKILIEEEIIDEEGSLNFKSFQTEISSSIKILRDLFGYLVIIIVGFGLFSFLRFIWMIGKYRAFGEFFIHYYLNNTLSLIISITLYLTISLMMTYVIVISLQKYIRLQLISKNYDIAMAKVFSNLDRLMKDENEQKTNSDDKA